MTSDGDSHDNARKNLKQDTSCPSGCLRALVVDDDSISAQLACRMLEVLGFSVKVAHGGEQALGELEMGGVDLLLTDLKMPCLNGIDLAERFRKRSKDMRIIIMTGCTPTELHDKMRLDTVDYWLFKPFDFAVLHETITGLFPTMDDSRHGD